MSTIQISIGQAKNYIIKIKPVLQLSSILLARHSDNQYSGILDYNDDTYYLRMNIQRSSIISEIKNVTLLWIFKPENEEEGISIEHPEKIILKKVGPQFQADSIKIPVKQLFDEHKNAVLHKKGSLSLSITIDDIEPIVVSENNLPQWDFTFNFSIKRNSQSFTFPELEGKRFTIGDQLEISCTKGQSLPDSFKAHLYIWENDVSSYFTSNYALKINADKTAEAKLAGRTTENDLQTNSYIFDRTGSQIHYVGCDDDRKINCGNTEAFSTNKFEFSAVMLYASDLEATGDEYKLIKDFDCPKSVYMDIHVAAQPVIELHCQKRQEQGHQNYFIRLMIKNISSYIDVQNLSLMLLKRTSSSFYEIMRSPPKKETQAYNNNFLDTVLVDEFKYLDENDKKYSWFWPENFFSVNMSNINMLEFKTGIQFNTPGWEKDYRLCLPLATLVSHGDKEHMSILFSGYSSSKAKSVKDTGNYGYSEDNPPKYKFIGFDFSDM